MVMVSQLILNPEPHIPLRPLPSPRDLLIAKTEPSLTTGGFQSNVLDQ
jgi:hypothetical protein